MSMFFLGSMIHHFFYNSVLSAIDFSTNKHNSLAISSQKYVPIVRPRPQKIPFVTLCGFYYCYETYSTAFLKSGHIQQKSIRTILGSRTITFQV